MNRDTLHTAPKDVRLAVARALIDKAAGGEQATASGGHDREVNQPSDRGTLRLISAGVGPAKSGKGVAGASGLPLVEGGARRVALRPLGRRGPIMVGRPGSTLKHVDHAATGRRAGQSTSVQATTREIGDVQQRWQ